MDGSPATNARQAPLSRGERFALLALFIAFVVFAGLVEYRSAFQHTRKGDLNVFLRAGWAIRADANPYAVTDDNGFHYHYPPLLAILAAPLADAPATADRAGMLPYAVSVAVCYVLNVLFLAFAVHRLAGVLEKTAAGPFRLTWSRGSRGWWALRVIPVLACLIPIGHTLMRGQVNLLLLALFAGFLTDLLRGRPFRAGLWLAGAICVKIIPAYLLLLPLWRRDGRCLVGSAIGLAVGLVFIPLVVLGPTRTRDCYREMVQTVLLPGMGAGADASRAEELTNQTATEGQSLLTALHNTLHSNPATRPPKASPTVRLVSHLLGGLLTLTTLWAFGWRRHGESVDLVLFFGALVLNMLLISPVCHLHYFSLALPLVMALLVERWRHHEALTLSGPLWVLLGANALANLLPNLPNMNLLRDCGSAMYGSLLLWLTAIVLLRQRRSRVSAAPQATLPLAA
ncbi:MAG TPA: glycosyltransferase family 87 protein [Gemmataceae bacterium]|nr:glycosyltransferase family 87 protein [Gemmataceae bacterium]